MRGAVVSVAETHTKNFDGFDLKTTLDDDGNVTVEFVDGPRGTVVTMDWFTLRDVVAFVATHPLEMPLTEVWNT